MSFDYFLNTKSLNKINRKLENNIYKTSLPYSTANKLNYNFVDKLSKDRFLSYYTKAFYDDFLESSVEKKLKTYELALLVMIETKTDLDFLSILKIFKEIKKGKRPTNYLERLIFNIIYAYEYIKKPKVLINEENLEMLISILLVGLEFDLDLKNNYYRTPKTKTLISNVLSNQQISKELESLLNYLKFLQANNLCTYSQTYLIFSTLVMISPFQKYNLIFATLLCQWISFQYSNSYKLVIPICYFLKNSNDYMNELDDLNNKDLNIDNVIDLFNTDYLKSINLYNHASCIYKWAKKDKKRLWVFEDDTSFIVLILILQNTKSLSFNNIKTLLAINKIKLFDDEQIKNALAKLAANQILQTTNNSVVKYVIVDKYLEKSKYLVNMKGLYNGL
ncbi:hypothetical protein [Mycoplasma feriruminatoris]|uniref:Fido domain-containing protein n=1 Tax=Mycoplasma feriruminatoris TaxID=1179777 RepID=A0AAX3TFR7_9MOLU|nr:hypothetical protein [Mycoplasma feriruminatoris]WFQ92971.1 hypothetical protein MFERI14822_00764 [Mycoplasma feriruminatoris]